MASFVIDTISGGSSIFHRASHRVVGLQTDARNPCTFVSLDEMVLVA